MNLSQKRIDAFWSRGTRDDKTGCLLWTGAGFRAGYGIIKIDGKSVAAHRLAWELVNGPIPNGDGYHGTCV